MNDSVKVLKGTITAFLAYLTALWGWFGWLVVAWVIFMVLDYATGTAAAWRGGTWSSKVARDGLWHKAGCIAAVLVSGMLDLVVGQLLSTVPDLLPFEYTIFLCPLVLTWYILTESGSILENAAKMGASLPPWLRSIVDKLKHHLDEEGEALAGKNKDPSSE